MGQAGMNRQLELFQQGEREMAAITTTARKEQCSGIPIYKVSLVREGKIHCYDTKIRSSANASDLLHRYLEGVDREHFVVVLLDRKSGHRAPYRLDREPYGFRCAST